MSNPVHPEDVKYILHDGREMTVREMKDEIRRLAPYEEPVIENEEFNPLYDASVSGDCLVKMDDGKWTSGFSGRAHTHSNPNRCSYEDDLIEKLIDRKMLAWSDEYDGAVEITEKGREARNYHGKF